VYRNRQRMVRITIWVIVIAMVISLTLPFIFSGN
jgi:hypothetical protein